MDSTSIATPCEGVFQTEESISVPVFQSFASSESVEADTPDFELTKLAASGNIAAFELLYKRYHRRTIRFVCE